MIKRFNCTNFY